MTESAPGHDADATAAKATAEAGREGGAFGALRIGLAWSVHLLTASGAVVGTIALLSIWQGRLDHAGLLMLLALFIDSIDGTLARRVGVREVLPGVDGRRLDDVVDYLNFVIVPVLFLVGAGALPGWAWTVPPVLASAYGFAQVAAKTSDNFFLGWPSYWNVVALYAWLLPLSPTATAAWVAGCSFAIFVPLKYVHPSRVPQPLLKHTLNAGGALWATALAVAIVWPDTSDRFHLVEISLSYLVYYMALSIWLGDWKRGWK